MAHNDIALAMAGQFIVVSQALMLNYIPMSKLTNNSPINNVLLEHMLIPN
jgi:hypothetical protein